MKTLEIIIDEETKNFNIPESWEEVSVYKTMQLYKLNEVECNHIEKIVKILNILTEVDESILYQMTQDQFMEIASTINFTNQEIKGELKDFVVLDGEEYYIKKDFDKLTVGEIISIDTIMTNNDNDLSKSMTQLLCVFLRKKLDSGKLEPFDNDFMEREELFRAIPITDINNIFSFFLDGKTS